MFKTDFLRGKLMRGVKTTVGNDLSSDFMRKEATSMIPGRRWFFM